MLPSLPSSELPGVNPPTDVADVFTDVLFVWFHKFYSRPAGQGCNWPRFFWVGRCDAFPFIPLFQSGFRIAAKHFLGQVVSILIVHHASPDLARAVDPGDQNALDVGRLAGARDQDHVG